MIEDSFIDCPMTDTGSSTNAQIDRVQAQDINEDGVPELLVEYTSEQSVGDHESHSSYTHKFLTVCGSGPSQRVACVHAMKISNEESSSSVKSMNRGTDVDAKWSKVLKVKNGVLTLGMNGERPSKIMVSFP